MIPRPCLSARPISEGAGIRKGKGRGGDWQGRMGGAQTPGSGRESLAFIPLPLPRVPAALKVLPEPLPFTLNSLLTSVFASLCFQHSAGTSDAFQL